MNSRQWCEKLRDDLRRQNLPPAYIDRLVEELTDHSIDLETETSSMDAQVALDRLGSTDKIAAVAGYEFHRQTFASRHPFFTFVVAPVAFVPFVFLVLVGGSMFLFFAFFAAADWVMDGSWPRLALETETTILTWCGWVFESYIRFIPCAVAAWLFCRWGLRNDMRRWALAACSIVALIAGFMVISTTLNHGGDTTEGKWTIHFGFHANLRQFLQILVPLAIAAWLLLRLPHRLMPLSAARNTLAT